MHTTPGIRPLTPHDDVAEVAETLARAFFDDPLQTYALPDADDRRRLSPAHFQILLEFGQKFGTVFVAPGAGAVVALPPGETDITDARAQEGGLTQLPARIGAEPAQRFMTTFETALGLHRRHAAGPHWYVMVLGVEPDSQGTGLGRGLLEEVFAEADTERHPVYLETLQPRNIAFYGHMGFAVVEQTRDSSSGLDLWGFVRPPKEVSSAPEPARRPRPRRRYTGRR